MPNGIWNKDTYLMDVPEPDKKRAAMTFDMLEDIHKAVKRQPDLCLTIMDKKISNNNKLNRRVNFSIAGGGGLGGAVALKLGWDFIKHLFSP
jgi:hypothetical protein